jgi:hypothetical protein
VVEVLAEEMAADEREQIMKALPHRYPFLMGTALQIDGTRIVGVKRTINEPHFRGFPAPDHAGGAHLAIAGGGHPADSPGATAGQIATSWPPRM